MIAKLKHLVIDRMNAAAGAAPLGAANADQRAELVNLYALGAVLMHAQTILFPAEQAAVFTELSEQYTETLDYRLPFDQVLIEFMQPVKVHGQDLLGIALSQDTFNRDDFNRFAAERNMVVDDAATLPDNAELHVAIGVFADTMSRTTWQVSNRQSLFDASADATVKNLAIACIGFINCENITLERQVADAKVNRKRAAKGKRQIEDYYLCRIRGVQYGAGGSGEATGRSVGFRFDVRGHFRRLATGRTTWVRAHQRGVEHELYRPKTYRVDRN